MEKDGRAGARSLDWEAGPVKSQGGQVKVDTVRRPRLQNGKVKVEE